jgi:uncharacterized protein (TIGR03086 family)
MTTTMTPVSLEPAARHLAELVGAVTGVALDRPTPCSAFTVAELLAHVGELAAGFRLAATKSGPTEPPGGAELAADWRISVPRDLQALAEAWHDPAAWTGQTSAGGADLPGGLAGMVALDELVIHGWDVARATGQPYAPDPAALETIHGFLRDPAYADLRAAIFGPAVDVPATAPLLDRVVALTGRDPAWPAA